MGCSCSNFHTTAGDNETEEILLQIDAIRLEAPDLLCFLPDLQTNHTQLELNPSLSNIPNLLRYIEAYTRNAILAFKFLNYILQYLDATRKASSSLKGAVMFFNNKDYIQTLSNMNDFVATGNPFALLLDEYSLVVEQHKAAKDSTLARKQKLASKLSYVKLSRKVWEGVCKAALVLTLASALVLSALGLPAVAASVTTAGPPFINTVEQWLDAILEGREEELKGEMEVIRQTFTASLVGDNLETMRAIVERVEIHLGLLADDVKFVLVVEDNEMVAMVAIDMISDKLTELDSQINRLETMVTNCMSEIKDRATAFFKLIMVGLG